LSTLLYHRREIGKLHLREGKHALLKEACTKGQGFPRRKVTFGAPKKKTSRKDSFCWGGPGKKAEIPLREGSK